jgi:hypothetical protein
MASIELVKEMLHHLFDLGFEEEIPRKYLVQQINLSSGRIDIGMVNRLIKSLIESDILKDIHNDGSYFKWTSFAYSLTGIPKPEPTRAEITQPAPAEPIDLGVIDENSAPIESKIENTRTPEEKMALWKKEYKVE